MTDLKNGFLNVIGVIFFFTLHFGYFGLAQCSANYLSFLYSKKEYDFYTENTFFAVLYSSLLFLTYGTMLILNKKYLINEGIVKLLISFIVTGMMVLGFSFFLLRLDFVLVIPVIICQIIVLYFLAKFEIYKVKIWYYNSSFFKKKKR